MRLGVILKNMSWCASSREPKKCGALNFTIMQMPGSGLYLLLFDVLKPRTEAHAAMNHNAAL